MANELFTLDGKRKYLSAEELDRFLYWSSRRRERLERSHADIRRYQSYFPALDVIDP